MKGTRANPASDWRPVAAAISEVTATPFEVRSAVPVGGGCIHRATLVGDGRRRFFVKRNRPDALAMFEAEAEGLEALGDGAAIRIPAPVCTGADSQGAWLVLEALDLVPGRADPVELGHSLAALHRSMGQRFGFRRDNFIGATPQANGYLDDWPAFWRDRRLLPQLTLAAGNGYRDRLQASGERLAASIGTLLDGHRPQPSLLHGDLWHGNAGTVTEADGEIRPVLFDPAVYYGDRETDLAMTELFGGFGSQFLAAYREAWPIADGYPVRRELYNLYHVLNHLNLFGSAWAGKAQSMIDWLLAEAG